MTASAYRPRERAGDRAFRKASREASDGGNVVAFENTQLNSTARALNMARNNLLAYCVASYPGFKIGRHTKIICNALERVANGEIKRLIIEVPPRHGKSMIASERFPAWYLGQHPDRYVMSITHGQDFADKFGRRVKTEIQSELYRAVFPDVKITKATQSVLEFASRGEYKAVGAGGQITGLGAHLMVIDDPIKDYADSCSETIRDGLWEWWESTARSRIMPGGACVVIQTRWQIDDFTGRLRSLHAKEGWHVISFPAIDDNGEALCEEIFPLKELQMTREVVDPKIWWSLYQQKPTVGDGAIFKREDFWSYDTLPTGGGYVIQSWDTAFGTRSINDYSVCQSWLVAKDGYYLLDQWRGRVDYDALFDKAVQLATKFNARAVAIEQAASGQSLIQSLQTRTRIPVIGLKPWNDKKKREGFVLERDEMHGAAALSSLIRTGKIKIPRGAPWLRTFVDEFCAYDGGDSGHDDQVKSAIVFASYITNNGVPNYSSYRGYRPVMRALY